MCKRTVIVSGGMLEEDFILPILEAEETEFIIGVDKGLAFLYEHKIKPDYIVGDFDSVPEEVIDYYRKEASVPIREFNLDSWRNRKSFGSFLGQCPVPEYCT